MLTSDDDDVSAPTSSRRWAGEICFAGGRAPKMLSATRMSMKASVSDVVMPGMNGRKRQQKALLREFRSATRPLSPVDRTRETGDLLSEL